MPKTLSLTKQNDESKDSQGTRHDNVQWALRGATAQTTGKEENDLGRTLRIDGNTPSDDQPVGKWGQLPSERAGFLAHRSLRNQSHAASDRPEKIIFEKFYKIVQSPVDRIVQNCTIPSATSMVRKHDNQKPYTEPVLTAPTLH